MRLVDSHAHVQVDAFASDLPGVLDAARAVGVERLLVPGYDAASSERAVAVAERFDWLDAAAGIHPHDAGAATDEDWETIVRLATDPRVVAIGETGLDFDRMHSSAEAQLSNLRRHLALARAIGKPAILHCRSANGGREAQDLLIAELRESGAPAVLHSYSGPLDYASAALELGAAISFSGLVWRGGEEVSADVARLVPGERLLVETDSPFLAPKGTPREHRRRNSPEWVRLTAEWVAAQRGEDSDAMGDRLVATYDRVFPRERPRRPPESAQGGADV